MLQNVLKIVAILVLSLPLDAQLLDGTRIYSDTSDGAEICVEELYTNGSAGMCLKAPDSITTEYSITISPPPGSTECLEITSAGVIQATGAACGGGGSTPPFADTTSIVEGSADGTKELRFEVDGFTTSTTRVLTPQNSNYTIAGINISQTFSATQTFSSTATFNSTADFILET